MHGIKSGNFWAQNNFQQIFEKRHESTHHPFERDLQVKRHARERKQFRT